MVFLIVFISVIIILAVFTASLRAYHVHMLTKEEPLRKPEGYRVEVAGKKMNVYTEGTGKDTIVFMSGHGTATPVLDFRTLYSKLSGDCRIVVAEKFGYGYSDDSEGRSRDIDTILSDTREALEKAGERGPFILCPHSMSGIEAIRWAQKYPDEVKAIIGMDIAYPGIYEKMKTNDFVMKYAMKFLEFLAFSGFTRLVPSYADREAIVKGTLTGEEKERYRAMFHARTAGKDMSEEAAQAVRNSEIVKEGGVPDVPFLMFVSDGLEVGTRVTSEHRQWSKKYLSQYRESRLVELDCGHYVHNHEPERIASEIRSFISSLSDSALQK